MAVESSKIGTTQQQILHPTLKGRLSLPSLGLHASERKLLLWFMDMLLINSALAIAVAVETGAIGAPADVLVNIKWFATLTVVWSASAFFFDCYNLARAGSTMASVRSTAMAVALAVLVYIFIPWLTPALQSRALIFLFAGLALVGVVGWRVVYAQLFTQPWFVQRALVVGAGWAGRTLIDEMRLAAQDANPFRGTGYDVLGFVDDREHLIGTDVAGLPVLGGQTSLAPMVEALGVDEVVVAITHRHAISSELYDALLRCRELGVRVSTMSDVYQRLTGRVPVLHVGGDFPIALSVQDHATERLFQVGKRLADLGLALFGLAALAILAPVVALVNARTSPGPLFYRQVRVGRGGRPFQMIKFRSMVPDAEQGTGAVWAEAGDNRITAIGRLLRGTRLDELPQVINVLRGEMSIIGPRPERPEFVEELAQEIPLYRARHAVRPGITGWAQVQYRYGNSQDDARIKLEYDLYYVKNVNLLLELRILLRTATVMAKMEGY